MIELNLDPMALDADSPDSEALEQGVPPTVHVQVIGGNELPFADPRNPNRPVRVPALAVNFQLNKHAALEFAALVKSKAESLPDDSASSKLEIVQDLSGVENVVDLNSKLKSGK